MNAAGPSPHLLWEILEAEIAPRLDFATLGRLGCTCRRLAASWPLAVTKISRDVPTGVHLARFKNLQEWTLGFVSPGMQRQWHGRRWTQLRHVNLYTLESSPATWAAVLDELRHCARLESLVVPSDPVIRPADLAALTSVTELWCTGEQKDAAHAYALMLAVAPRLRRLDMMRMTMDSATLRRLSALERLQIGCKDEDDLTGKDYYYLPHLTSLDLLGPHGFSETACGYLTGLVDLHIHGLGLDHLPPAMARLTRLRSLHLSPPASDWLSYVARYPALSKLEAAEIPRLPHELLTSLPTTLRRLTLSSPPRTETDPRRLAGLTRLVALTYLDVHLLQRPIPGADYAALTNLVELRVNLGLVLPEAGLQAPTNLRRLSLHWSPKNRYSRVLDLAHCRYLEDVDCQDPVRLRWR